MVDVIRVEIEDQGLRERLNQVLTRTRNLSPILKVIGERILRQTEERFKKEQSPDGSSWPAAKYPEGKTHPKLLSSKRMRLRGGINYHVSGNRLEVRTTNVPYAAIHQLGGKTSAHIITARIKQALFWKGAGHPVKSVRHPGSVIPARPFLGLSRDNETEICEIIDDYLVRKT